MTPATRIAKKAGIDFKIHEYSHNPNATSYGDEAATLLGVEPSRVFKTLLVETNENKLAVAIVPVTGQLSLKATAKALGVKKVAMANPAEAEKATGYILGGISPLGQKKRLPFIIDDSLSQCETVFVSGGKRGLEIELKPADLIQLCHAKCAKIKEAVRE